MKLLPLLPYLFDGTVSEIYDENSTIVVVESPGGVSHIEFRYPDGEKQETELQELTEDDLTDEDFSVRRNPVNAHIDLLYYKTLPLLVGIEELLNGEREKYAFRVKSGLGILTFKRIDGTRVLHVANANSPEEAVPFVLDRETIGAGLFD